MTQFEHSEQNETMYTVKEVARMLRVSTGTIRNLIRDGQLRALRVGHQQRIPKSSYDRYVNPQEE